MFNKVSIIINCFNSEKYLKQCLDSVINQTYQNFEAIIWDNQSTDNTKKIFDQFKDNRLKYFYSEEFTNLSEARNRALEKISGNYIAFLDSDDEWHYTKLEKQITFMKQNNADISFTNYYKKIEGRKFSKIKKYYHKFPKKNLIENLLKIYFVSISTVIIDKRNFGPFSFNRKYHMIGDFDFILQHSLSKKILGINKPLAVIRFHQNNESKKNFLKNVFESKIWFNLNKFKFRSFKNFNNLKSQYRYNLLRYLIMRGKSKQKIKLFLYIDVIKKIKIILLIFLNFFKLRSFY